jgi:hypothetical protein
MNNDLGKVGKATTLSDGASPTAVHVEGNRGAK